MVKQVGHSQTGSGVCFGEGKSAIPDDGTSLRTIVFSTDQDGVRPRLVIGLREFHVDERFLMPQFRLHSVRL